LENSGFRFLPYTFNIGKGYVMGLLRVCGFDFNSFDRRSVDFQNRSVDNIGVPPLGYHLVTESVQGA
jgi:hypothetical protein